MFYICFGSGLNGPFEDLMSLATNQNYNGRMVNNSPIFQREIDSHGSLISSEVQILQ